MVLAMDFDWNVSEIPPIESANIEDFLYPLPGVEQTLSDMELTEVLKTEASYYLLDLEYPCFTEGYVDKEELTVTWQLVKSLAEYIRRQKKLSEAVALLKKNQDLIAFEDEFTKLRNDWLKEEGIELLLEPRVWPVQYGSYGRFQLLQMKTLHANWYVTSEYYDNGKSLQEDFYVLRRNYRETADIMQTLEQEFEIVKEKLAGHGYEYSELTIWMKDTEYYSTCGMTGYYDSTKNCIVAGISGSLVHEYCHFLMEGVYGTWDSKQQQYAGQLHLLPYYYGGKSEIRNLMDRKQLHYWQENEEQWAPTEEFLKRVHGETMLEQEDWYIRYMDLACYSNPKYIPSETNPAANLSFSFYLANTYGEDFLFQVATGNDKIENLTGRTWESLLEEWRAWLAGVYDEEFQKFKEERQ